LEHSGYAIAVVERTADLVAALVRIGPASLSSLAAEAGCTPARAFRILHTLQAHRLVLQRGHRGPWQLGVGWFAVARAAATHRALQETAAPMLAALAERCSEAIYLAVRDGQEYEVLSVATGAAPLRLYAGAGDRFPLHAGPGRLLLAYAPSNVQRAVLSGRLARLGPATRTEAAWISADLPRIRARNWLITKDEIIEGAVTVSTAVRDDTGTVVAAISIAAPSIRMPPPRPHAVLSSLLSTAEALGLAFGPPPAA
jgi:DNA-binding IclR family transcriptional regulator